MKFYIVPVLLYHILTLTEATHPDPVVKSLMKSVQMLTRQVMLQQLYIEEASRSSGHSGIKQIRVNSRGTRPYYR